MYSREQISQIRKEFWTVFGQIMRPVPSAEGVKVNWVNYKTGFKGLRFRLNVDKRHAVIGIELNQKDPDLRILFYEQLQELKGILHSEQQEEWIWEANAANDQQQEISRVYTMLEGVSLFNKEDWPAIISFLKQRIIALDEFWSVAKYHFEPLK